MIVHPATPIRPGTVRVAPGVPTAPDGAPLVGGAGGAVTLDSPAAFTFPAGEVYGYSVRSSSTTGNTIQQTVLGAGATSADMLQGVVEVQAGSTITQAHAVAGYAKNNNPRAFAPPGGVEVGCAVVYGGFGWAAVDGADVWGVAIALSDVGPAGGLGRILTNEWDFNVGKTNTKVVAHALTGASGAQPTTAEGYMVASLGPSAVWTIGHGTYDGTAAVAYRAGLSLTAGAAKPSQPLRLSSTNGSGTRGEVDLLSTAGKVMNVVASGGRADFAASGFVAMSAEAVNLTAGMVDQGTAYGINKQRTYIGTAPSGSSVRLPAISDLPPGTGTPVLIRNAGANAIRVYPAVGEAVQGAATNVQVVLAAGARAEYWPPGAGSTWIVEP